MHERIAERGEAGYIPSTPSTSQVQGLYGDQDSDDSLSSASEVANEDAGTRYNVSEEIYEQSNCSEDSVNLSNDAYEPSEHLDQQSELSSDGDEESDQGSDAASVTSGPTSQSGETEQRPDIVQMACVQEFHHYRVDRASEDGEPSNNDNDDDDYPHGDVESPPNQYEDRDGQLWSYNEDFIECDHTRDHGWDCKSPVERHWVESEVLDWVQDSDERENSPKYEGEDDKEEEFEEDSETEEDLFVDELELEVENYY